ncbi:MAG: FkbM family methyltransferase [Kiritimatiellae bacterium]|nr:FkbM family methyltransferase [Kiritimatiellia bacterium]
MKIHLYHLRPFGLVRAFYQLVAGRKYCRAHGAALRPFVPECINPMTAAWNYWQTVKDLPRPGTIIDVGANVSQMARLLLLSCAEGAEVYSFEPIPTLEPIGRRFRIALSDRDGTADFYIPFATDDELGSLNRSFAEHTGARYKTIQVETARFETLVKEGKIDWKQIRRPILLKLDTEGSELQALKGFGDLLREIDYVITEVGNAPERGMRYDLTEVCAHMTRYGFDSSRVIYACYEGPLAPPYVDVLFWRSSKS